jgi:hypothetical protein
MAIFVVVTDGCDGVRVLWGGRRRCGRILGDGHRPINRKWRRRRGGG